MSCHMLDWKKCCNDPLPTEAIRISEAFESVFQAVRDNPQVLDTLDPGLKDLLVKNRQQEIGAVSTCFRAGRAKTRFIVLKRRWCFFAQSCAGES